MKRHVPHAENVLLQMLNAPTPHALHILNQLDAGWRADSHYEEFARQVVINIAAMLYHPPAYEVLGKASYALLDAMEMYYDKYPMPRMDYETELTDKNWEEQLREFGINF